MLIRRTPEQAALLSRGMAGPLEGPSAYFMKSPGVQYRDEEARELVEAYARLDADLK